MLTTLSAFLSAHAATLWPVVSAIGLALLRRHTADEWLALGQSQPRVQGAIKLASALGLDPRKAYEGAVQILTAKAPPVPTATLPPAAPSTTPPVQP